MKVSIAGKTYSFSAKGWDETVRPTDAQTDAAVVGRPPYRISNVASTIRNLTA